MRSLAYFVLGLALSGFLGCQHGPTRTAVEGPGGAVVFPSPQLLALRPQLAGGDGPLPWYAGRNDLRLTTVWGTRSSTVEHSTTRVYEYLDQHRNRVDDHMSIRTYRSRSTRTER